MYIQPISLFPLLDQDHLLLKLLCWAIQVQISTYPARTHLKFSFYFSKKMALFIQYTRATGVEKVPAPLNS